MITFRYVIDVLDDAGDAIGRITAQPDWRAAMAWVRLEGIREGRLRPVVTTGAGSVDPVWNVAAGAPYVEAFRVTIGPVVRDIPLTYLRGIVQRAQAALVAQDVLAAGAGFRWVVSAFPADAAPAAPADGFAIEEIEHPLPLDEASLAACLADVEAVEPSAAMPVFIPQRVLDEAMTVARATPDVEAGGVLVGRLHRDTDSPELFVEITAQVPALHTRATSATLTFTSDTWAAVDAAIALRGRGEGMMGWYHSHPNWCRLRGCPLERRRRCDVAGPFFSQEDVYLHAACFGAPWHIGLLISDGDITGGMTTSLYGWGQGMVVPRGFHVIGRTNEGAIHATHATS